MEQVQTLLCRFVWLLHHTHYMTKGFRRFLISDLLFGFKNPILICFLLLLSGNSFTQKQGAGLIDSLKSSLQNSVEDTNKVNLLARLSFEYFGFDTDLGISYGEKALTLSKTLGWKKGIALAYNSLGANWAIKSNYPRAFDCYMKSLSKFTEIGDNKRIANALNNIGWLYIFQKEYRKSLEALTKSEKINIQLNNTNGLANNYANLGICYAKQGDFTKANEYYYKVLKVHTKVNNKTSIAIDLSNISKNKMKMKNYCEALQDGFAGLKISEEINNTYSLALLNRIIGEIYLMVASETLNSGNTCYFYKDNKNANLYCAAKHLAIAFKLFNKINDLSSVSESSYLLSQVYEQLEDNKNALKFFKKYTENKDSVYSRDNSLQIMNIEKNREIDLRDKQIVIQELEIKNNARLSYLLFAVTLIILLILGLFLVLYISKRKANRQLEEKNKVISEVNSSKDKFFSIISHDLRSPFNTFLGFTEILADELPNLTREEIQKIVFSMRNSAKNLFRLLENLLQWSRLERGVIHFNPASVQLQPIVNDVLDLIKEQALNKEIEIISDIPDGLEVCADRNMLQTLIRNLISNAVKYTNRGGKIKLSAKYSGEKYVEIAIQDSGIGMNQEILNSIFLLEKQNSRKGTEGEPSTGLGLIICKEFVEKHKGDIWAESKEDQGSTFHFTLPDNTGQYPDVMAKCKMSG
ncbi:MAG: tetratricopeptide repeat-containing sensor histidine kinase [Bacteroidetes bacterium]|nr:tetratricopeptide repeat-containing sensor histidine kinase [Bacteroidota bacterium]